MKLIVGLGNPGKEYKNTRHNVGFDVVDEYLKKHNQNVNKSKFEGMYSELIINGEKVIFLEPQKYMNLSGEVVKAFVDYFKIDISDILIINDDLDLEVGKFRLKPSGSSGGHNGLKNIAMHLQTENYKRLKIGISNNKNIDTKDYVLGKFSSDDLETYNNIFNISVNIINDFIKNDFDKVMSKYNHK